MGGETLDAQLVRPIGSYRVTAGNMSSYHEAVASLIVALHSPAVAFCAGFRNPPSGLLSKAGITMQAPRAMWGLARQLQQLSDAAVDGDVYECGTWRGGTSIFMIAVLRWWDAFKGRPPHSRRFYFFDSFQGFQRYGKDKRLDDFLADDRFAAPLESVRAAFQLFGVLPILHGQAITFKKGFFEKTLPAFGAPPRPIAMLRMDGDLYSSTHVLLHCLVSAVPVGGWIVIDDYLWTVRVGAAWVERARMGCGEEGGRALDSK
jgi:hypothetical protein